MLLNDTANGSVMIDLSILWMVFIFHIWYLLAVLIFAFGEE